MPHILFLSLVPEDRTLNRPEMIKEAINKAIIGTEGLNLTADDITHTFVEDSTVVSGKTPVVIVVDLLFIKPERTFKVCQELAASVGCAFQATVRGWRQVMPASIEVAVRRFDQTNEGFCKIIE